ncbi:MAG: histidine kinase, partial [Desulfobacteraceae bacterium]|nr:histidine kinase [Desulfobacteraceae bacterium]
NYIGGGAGSLSMVSKPCLFSNDGLLMDSAILAFFELDSGIGVSHGWESISGPYRVTEADHNIIKTLDFKPAFEAYSDAILEHSGLNIAKDHFFDIAKEYPFGIAKLGAERIVRDPIKVFDNGNIMCVGEVREGSFVDILNGDAESLIAAAGHAKQLSMKAKKDTTKNDMALFIDCISRVLFLEDKFTDEITEVWSEDLPLVGACTIGEIANSGNDYLEFYNKTAVVAIIGSK